MIQYSAAAKRVVSRFFRYRNQIDIYTEDEAKDKEFYLTIFTRLLTESGIIISDIYPIGSKSQVIQAARDEPDDGRKKIFVVDGDIEVVDDSNIGDVPNLFVLDSYCIENYLINESAIVGFTHRVVGTQSKDSISKALNFEKWLDYNSEALIDLFIHFSICRSIGLKFELFTANRFSKKNGKESILDIEKVEAYIEQIKVEILKAISDDEYARCYQDRIANWPHESSSVLRIVSGKNYLIPLVQMRIQKIKKLQGLYSLEAIKLNLAMDCDLNRLQNLREAIINA